MIPPEKSSSAARARLMAPSDLPGEAGQMRRLYPSCEFESLPAWPRPFVQRPGPSLGGQPHGNAMRQAIVLQRGNDAGVSDHNWDSEDHRQRDLSRHAQANTDETASAGTPNRRAVQDK